MGQLDTVQPIMSRVLLALGARERRKALGESGYGLVDFAPDPLDLRRNRTHLTTKGRKLLAGVVAAVNKAKK
jgi:DNA-binding MarR family transcriptional regulator